MSHQAMAQRSRTGMTATSGREAHPFRGAQHRSTPSVQAQVKKQRRRLRVLAMASNTGDTLAASSKIFARSLRTGLATAQGPRESMEDAATVAIYEPCDFLFTSVFDGHGGAAAANYLQSGMYKILCQLLDKSSRNVVGNNNATGAGLGSALELTSLLQETYKRADTDLLAWLAKHAVGTEKDSGCTATTVLLGNDRVVAANVGDSRAVLCRRGQAIDLTAEHRVYGRGLAVLAETERVEAVGGWVEDGRVCGMLAVSRAFGDAEFKGDMRFLQRGVRDGFWTEDFARSQRITGDPISADPEITEIMLQNDDEFVVLATDGLWDTISSQEVCRIVKANLAKGLDPQEVANKLCEFAIKRHTQDNVAAVVIELKQQGSNAAPGSTATNGKKGLFGLFR